MNTDAKYDLIIIGGGAAGLAAAVAYSRERKGNFRAAVLEKEQKFGRRLLATGNGRCNLTNLSMSEKCYNRAARPLIKELLRSFPPERLMSEFAKLGLPTKPDSAGRVYPMTNTAQSVLDILLMWCRRADSGISLFTDSPVSDIRRTKGGFLIRSNDTEFFAGSLILAAGGCVQSALGADGSSYKLAEKLGLPCTEIFPSLAPIPVSDKSLSIVKGVRAAAAVSVIIGGKRIKTERGELQFNEKNISGICIFQLSRIVNEAFANRRGEIPVIEADLLPDMTEEALLSALHMRVREFPNADMQSLFTGILPQKLSRYIIKRAKTEAASLSRVTPRQISALASLVKHCRFTPCAPSPLGSAQVTAGGISTAAVDGSFRCKTIPNLCIIGEALDADGICGGYNLHFAFSSGITAGITAAKNN